MDHKEKARREQGKQTVITKNMQNMQNIQVVHLYEDCLFLKIQKSQLRNPIPWMTEPENHSDISYYYVGQAETSVFSAHNSQQVEESHHREGRREWLDGHVQA